MTTEANTTEADDESTDAAFDLDDDEQESTSDTELDGDDESGSDKEDTEEQARLEAVQKERAEEERAVRAAAARAARVPAPAARPQGMLVRIKPYHPKKGQTMRTHSFNHNGVRAKFVEGAGWYDVDSALAHRVSDIRCSDMDPDSPLAFDVCTPAEARRMDAREEQEREQETRSPAKRPRSATA